MDPQAPGPGPFTVYVDDNFHYRDEAYRTRDGSYADCAAAIARCKEIVDDSLRHLYRAGMAADELLRLYQSFGDDPWIESPDAGCRFSAWEHARERCEALCGRKA